MTVNKIKVMDNINFSESENDRSLFDAVLCKFLESHKNAFPNDDTDKLKEKFSKIIKTKDKEYNAILHSENRDEWISGFVDILVDIIAEEKKNSPNISEYISDISWEGYGVFPKNVIRSALFSSSKHTKEEENLSLEKLNSQENIIEIHGDYIMTYVGPRLTQTDKDVLSGCIELSRKIGEKNVVNSSLYSLCSVMQKSKGTKNYNSLERSLERFTRGTIKITATKKKFSFTGSFIHNLIRKDNSIYFEFNDRLKLLFEQGFTHILLEHRTALKSDLDKWMYDYFTTHEDGTKLSIKKLKALSGSLLSETELKKKLKGNKSTSGTIQRLRERTNIKIHFIDKKETIMVCRKSNIVKPMSA